MPKSHSVIHWYVHLQREKRVWTSQNMWRDYIFNPLLEQTKQVNNNNCLQKPNNNDCLQKKPTKNMKSKAQWMRMNSNSPGHEA